MPFATFIIPSKGRKTLADTLSSLYEQTDEDWNAIVCFDNVEFTISNRHPKVIPIKTPSKLGTGVNGAGNVRNYGIDCFKTLGINSTWICFVDDDDIITNNYVSLLLTKSYIHNDIDIFVFSMLWSNGRVLPRDHNLSISQLENDIGISFACKKEVFDKINFTPSSGEDYQFLKRAENAGFKIKILPDVTYLVSPLGTPEDRK